MTGKQLPATVHVIVLGQRPINLEVVAPAGELKAVVSPAGR
jgi:hypothetical protein